MLNGHAHPEGGARGGICPPSGDTLLSVLIMLVLTMNGYETVEITLNMFK